MQAPESGPSPVTAGEALGVNEPLPQEVVLTGQGQPHPAPEDPQADGEPDEQDPGTHEPQSDEVVLTEPDEAWLAQGRAYGADEADRRGETGVIRAERIRRAEEYARFDWRRRRGDFDVGPVVREVERLYTGGPDPKLPSKAAKASKHPGGWDG